MGAIGDPFPIDTLIEYQGCEIEEIAETCELALNRLKYFAIKKKDLQDENEFGSIDPAPPSDEKDISILEEIYLNEYKPIFERYRAMFALRNLNKEKSTTEIITQGNVFLNLNQHSLLILHVFYP